MKVDPVVNNNEELFMTNISQNNKIKFLESDKQKREGYIKDLQESLALNKESLVALTRGEEKVVVEKLSNEISHLHEQLKRYYNEHLNSNASLLIEQQLRIEEKKFYNERILDFETNIIELRKYLQDKEESFASVVNRLKKYEDLSEVTLETKLYKFQQEFAESTVGEYIKSIVEERDRYKTVCEKLNISLSDFGLLKDCFERKKTYEAMQAVYLKTKEEHKNNVFVKEEKGIEFYERTKNTTNASSSFNKNESQSAQMGYKNPNKELIKLLKKERLNNELLQEALNEAIEKNEELIIQNTTIIESNQLLSIRSEKLESKCYLLEQELTRYDRSLGWKQYWKSKCDLDRQQRIKEFEEKGEENAICLIALEEDMERLSSFIITSGLKGKGMSKSSSNPNLSRGIEEGVEEGEDLGILEI